MPHRYEKGAKIMNGKWKRYRILLIAAGMAVCMTAGLGMGISWSRSRTEKMVTQAADKEFAVFLAEPVADTTAALTTTTLIDWRFRKLSQGTDWTEKAGV